MKTDPWETIIYDRHGDTLRMKVPNGWLVKATIFAGDYDNPSVATSMVFIEDCGHLWRI